MRSELRSKGMGVYPVIGHWQECQDPDVEYKDCLKDQLKDVVERSFLVAKPNDMSQNDFKQLIQDLTSKYQQDGAVLSIGGVIYIIDKNGKLDKKGTNITLNTISQAFSQYVKKKDISFVFESEVPGSNSGRQLFEKEQLRYPRCSKEELRNW